MYKVQGKELMYEVHTLDEAMKWAKKMDEFVTITGPDFEIVGMFGSDTIEDGVLPDGHEYTWKKRR